MTEPSRWACTWAGCFSGWICTLAKLHTRDELNMHNATLNSFSNPWTAIAWCFSLHASSWASDGLWGANLSLCLLLVNGNGFESHESTASFDDYRRICPYRIFQGSTSGLGLHRSSKDMACMSFILIDPENSVLSSLEGCHMVWGDCSQWSPRRHCRTDDTEWASL